MFEHKIEVSGRIVTLRAYTEKRLKALNEINTEISEFIRKNPTMVIDDVPKDKKVDWWMRKAEILWQAEPQLPKSFFEDDDFESSKLKDTEDFFITRRLYL